MQPMSITGTGELERAAMRVKACGHDTLTIPCASPTLTIGYECMR